MLTAPSIFCQSGYPTKAVINGDTVCILRIDQVADINSAFVELDECVELNGSLRTIIDTCADLVDEQANQLTEQGQMLVLKDDIIRQQKGLLKNSDVLLAKMEKNIKLGRIEKIGLAVLVLLLVLK